MTKRLLSVAVLGGLLLGIGTVFYTFWFLSLFSFGAVMYILEHAQSKRARFGALGIVGGIAYACSFYGLYWEAFPLDWLGLSNRMAIGLLMSVWGCTVLVFGTCFSAVLFFGKSLLSGKWVDGFVVAALYVLADVLGMFGYSLFFFSPQALTGAHFSMGSPAYQLADSPLLLQTSVLGGMYTLLFLQALIGCLVYSLYKSLHPYPHRIYSVGTVIIILIILGHVPALAPNRGGEETVSVAVAGVFSETPESDMSHEVIASMLTNLSPQTNIVALPEDSRFIQYLTKDEGVLLRERFEDVYVLDSGTYTSSHGLVPEIQYYSGEKGMFATSSKEFLMIFGEYVPSLYVLVTHLIGLDDVAHTLDSEHGYITNPSNLFVYNGVPMSVKLCSDAISPVLYAKETERGATVLFNLASHGWFHRSELLYELSKRVGKVRAVESGRWYIRSAHETPALVLDEKGVVVAETAWHENGVVQVQVPLLDSMTLYTQIRSWSLAIPLLIVFGALYYRRKELSLK